jgi:hypothetical protein
MTLTLLMRILHVSTLCYYLVAVDCVASSAGSGVAVVQAFPSVPCWEGMHLAVALIAIMMVVAITVVAYYLSMVHFHPDGPPADDLLAVHDPFVNMHVSLSASVVGCPSAAAAAAAVVPIDTSLPPPGTY